MNEKFKRRLIGLIVLLALLFALTWVLPHRAGNDDSAVPSTIVPLTSTPIGGMRAAGAGTTTGNAAKPEGFNKAYEMGDAEGAAQIPPEERSAPGEAGRNSSTISTTPEVDAKAPEVKPEKPPPPSPPPVAVAKAKPPPPVAKIDKPAVVAAPAISKSDRLEPFPAAPAPAPPASSPPISATQAAGSAPDLSTWYVQIGSFGDQRNAQTTLSLLQNIGYRGETTPVAGANGSTFYRVRLGPFPNEATARAAQDKVVHQGYPQSRAIAETSHGR